MTVSGSTDFSYTAADIVTYARSALGIQPDEEPVTAAEMTKGIFLLNGMLKSWQAEGVRTWAITEGGPLTLVQAQASYSFGAGGDVTTVPFEMVQIRIRRSGVDLEMIPMTRGDYFAMPNKDSQGYPTQFYYDRQRQGATLYVWPAPDSSAAALYYTYQRVIDDVDAQTNALDMPQEWFEALYYGLAERMVPHYGKGGSKNAQLVVIEAQRSYTVVKNWDTAEGLGEISILPAGYGR